METLKENLLKLSGRKDEIDWLSERLEVMSVREEIILAAASRRHSSETAEDMIRCLQSMPYHEVCAGAGSHFALGQFFMEYENTVRLPKDVVAFVYMDKLGERYEAEHPGVFVGNNYVQYPPKGMAVPQYDGVHLPPKDCSWSIRLKLGSAARPEGVWVCLPDYDDINGDRLGEIGLAFQELGVEHISECTLLDSKCVLPNITDLMEYSDLAGLIYDGQNLGILMDEHGQGQLHFMERFQAALELEGCDSLKGAIDVADNLNRYEFVPAGELESYGRQLLRNADGTILDGCIDYASYAEYTLEQKGFKRALNGEAYISGGGQDLADGYVRQTPEMTM